MKKAMVRLALLFVTTTTLTGCIWPFWSEGDEERREHGEYGNLHEGHHEKHHEGNSDQGERR